MKLIYKFDNGYSCNIEKNIIYDPDECPVADLTYVVKDLHLNLKDMTDTSVWGLCSPIVAAHKNGVKKGRKQMFKRICSAFGFKEGKCNA